MVSGYHFAGSHIRVYALRSMIVNRVKPATPLSAISLGWRLFFFYGLALLMAGGISLLFADLLWRKGWTPLSSVLFGLFVILLLMSSIGSVHGIYGFILRRLGDGQRITMLKDFESQDISETSTAILFPIYNENANEVYERLKSTFLSLEKTGDLARFDFHILSDSTEAINWVDEENRWLELTKSLEAAGKIFYRRRLWNDAKKSGNIRDFLNALGNRYRYFIVFDADSLMIGRTIVKMVKLMEAHPDVGLIQTPPALVNAESLFGRIHQFANRLYSPLFTTGLNYWMQNFGNYWGHNAIIRTAPFMEYCGLPKLPGKKPFGGQILSHDFVEAALMLKNQWQVWLAHDLDGSYEEGPQGLIEYAQRDRRWCQGNLQHTLVLFSHGLQGISRLHLIFGILGYLSGPLWLLFLLSFNAQRVSVKETGLSDITVRAWTPFLNLSATQHALLIFALSTFLLFLPKILALFELVLDRERRRAFGGLGRASLSASLEVLFSMLQAPLQMLWHTEFVITILLGKSVNWSTQQRQADGTAWSHAFRQLWKHTLIGGAWGFLVWKMDHAVFWWFLPVLAGMFLSIPFTVLTSRRKGGRSARHAGLFMTPEETNPTPEIVLLRSALQQLEKGDKPSNLKEKALERTILNPYRSALHIQLLRERDKDPGSKNALKKLSEGLPTLESLRDKLLKEGIQSLTSKEKLLILSDVESLEWLYREIWRRPTSAISLSWQQALKLSG
jgi:membrane glycosyltransferase